MTWIRIRPSRKKLDPDVKKKPNSYPDPTIERNPDLVRPARKKNGFKFPSKNVRIQIRNPSPIFALKREEVKLKERQRKIAQQKTERLRESGPCTLNTLYFINFILIIVFILGKLSSIEKNFFLDPGFFLFFFIYQND